MQQPTQHIPMNLGQPSGGMDSSAHQGNHSTNALFPNGLPHSSMGNDPLTSVLSLLPPELLQSHQHMHQPFGPLASSQPTTSASLLSHVHNQLQPGSQQLLPQQNRGPQGLPQSQQPGPLSDNQHGHHQQQQRQRPQQQRQSSQQAQQQQLPGQQGQQQPSLRPQSNLHLNPQQHPPTSQAQPTPNLAQLLGSNPAALGAQPSLLQQHASILSDARSSVSSFSQSLHEAKQATPSDRGDIRNVVALLERASKALASELDQGVSKLRALSNSPAYNNVAGIFNGAGFGQANTAGHDLFGALNNFGMPGSGLQQQQHNAGGGGMPFDLGLAFPQPPHPNGMFNLNGAANANGPAGSGGGFNAAFSNDVAGPANGQQGPGTQNSPFLSALLAQYLSQSGDPASRMGALSLFQSIANGGTNGPTPNATQGLEALLNQGLPQQQQQQQQQQSRVGISGMDGSRVNHQAAAAQLASGAPLSNAAALAALTSLGITPTMLEALGLGSVAQQMLDAPADATSKQEASGKLAGQMRASPDLREDSPEADQNDASSEPARKKRKQARNKAISSSPHANAEASSSKQPIQPADAKNPSAARPGPPAAIHSAPSKPAIPSHPASNPNLPGSAGPSDASKRIPTLGVGLRQEGDKRYRNRKLLRDLREHLYRWLGTDEFRKLRNTYKVAEWVPNPHLTEEEKQILATLPTGAVAQPPITTHIFHVDFTSRDFYRTNQSLIDAIVTEGSKKVEAKPEAYAIVPGTIDRDHLEDVAKDLMDSARSGFRMSLRTGLQAEKEDKEKHEKYRGVERAKTKCRNREIGAGRLRHAIPKQLLIPGAYSDDAASDEDLHGLTKSEWKRQRLRKLRIAKGWEAVTPKWRNKHLTRAYHKADIVSKSKQMARWRRDDPVDLPIPIKLYGKLLPKQLFDPDWLAEHRKELEDEPYCIRINDNDIEGWDEGHHPLGEDTSDEMEWSDAKESSLHARGRPLMSAASSSRDRGSTTQSPAPGASSNAALKTVDAESKPGSATPQPTTAPASVSKDSPDTVSAVSLAPPEDAPKPASDTNAGSEGSGTSSVSGSSRSGHPDAGSDSDSDSSVPDKTTVPPTTDQAATTSSTDAANSASVAPAKSATAAPEARSES